jgi:hypothetical protein
LTDSVRVIILHSMNLRTATTTATTRSGGVERVRAQI